MIGIIVPLGIIAIPLVAMLNAHQRRMAEIIHRNPPANQGEFEAIRLELSEMRQLMNQHTIALDDMRARQALPPIQDDVQNRLEAS